MPRGVPLDLTVLPPPYRARGLEAQARIMTARKRKQERYLNDPVAWAHDCIIWPDNQDGSPGGLTDYQAEGLAALAEHRRVAMRAPHGTAKSALASIATWWMAITRDQAAMEWKIVTTAGRWHQLVHYLWPEIHKWAARLNWDRIGRPPVKVGSELMKRELQLRHGLAFAVAVADPNAIEGAHADELLYIFDEAKLVADAVFDAAEGAFSTAGKATGTNAYALTLSVPGEPLGRFYDICSHKPGTENWWARWVTIEEAIAAGRVTVEWVDQCRLLWGEDSALFKNRCLGQFASAEADGVIPLSWVEAANARWMELFGGRLLSTNTKREPHLGTPFIIGYDEPLHVIGHDVARAGGDSNVWSLRQGNAILELRRDSFTDNLVLLAERSGAIQDQHPDPEGGQPKIVVDADGLGSGVYDILRTAGHRTVAFHGSGATKRRDATGELGFRNVRAAAWWNLREMLDPAAGLEVALPPDDKLTGDLVAPHYRIVSGSRIQVEEKEEIVKRLKRSPDDGDSVVMAMWESAGGMSWADVYEEIGRAERGEQPPEPEVEHWQDLAMIRAGKCVCGEDDDACEPLLAAQRDDDGTKAWLHPSTTGVAPPVLQPKAKPRSTGGWHTMYAPAEDAQPTQGPPAPVQAPTTPRAPWPGPHGHVGR